MRCALNLNGCIKLEKNSFNKILAMKISVVFEFNSTNSFSADTNLDTFRFKKTEKENIWMAVEKMRKGKRKFERKRKSYKLCREEMGVTEELNCGTATVNKDFVVLLAIYLGSDDSNQGEDLN